MPLKKLSLVLGGAASGKSAFAEGLVGASGRRRVYIATAQALDAEMAAKIAAHRAARGPDWRTIEAPLDPAAALATVAADEVALIDCATLWLSNLMLGGDDVTAAEARLVQALAHCPAPVVVVSNEVGQGLVPETALGRAFRNAQGGLNRRLAARADLVVAVIAGLPLVLKGAQP
jgi:adenosylcobinamide kinase/adenosylcobinamide-phosphate guanylyltransferase